MGKRALDREVSEELKNGPIENRSCRDILCCLLFIANVIAISILFISAISTNNLSKLMAGFDTDLKACGVDSGYTGYNYLYFNRID